MPIKRHDWIKYKQDYFNSPIDSIKDFFDTFPVPVPKSSYKAQTQGWIEEKQEYKQRQAEAAQAKALRNPKVKNLTEQLIIAKENALKIVMMKMQKEKDNLGMREIREGLDIIKRELGEPLTITDNRTKLEGSGENGEIEIKLNNLSNDELMQFAQLSQKLQA